MGGYALRYFSIDTKLVREVASRREDGVPENPEVLAHESVLGQQKEQSLTSRQAFAVLSELRLVFLELSRLEGL